MEMELAAVLEVTSTCSWTRSVCSNIILKLSRLVRSAYWSFLVPYLILSYLILMLFCDVVRLLRGRRKVRATAISSHPGGRIGACALRYIQDKILNSVCMYVCI